MDEYMNKGILCDVCNCEHNCEGRKCRLDTVKITNNCSSCTCCDSYQNIEE